MKHYDKLIIVSESDTATGPMVEAIMQREFMLEDILITSKGLVVLFPEPINPKVEAVLVSHGFSMKDHISEPLTDDDFDGRTLIITISNAQKERIIREHKSAKNVFSLGEYTHSDQEIKDPYGGSLADYNRCFCLLKDQAVRVTEILIKEENILSSN